MSRINLNSWYIKDSKLEVTLELYQVSITPVTIDGKITSVLKVVDTNMNSNKYKFGNIEDAMVFTEDVIKNCISLEEIEEGYNLYKESKEENKENSEEIKEVKVKKKTHQNK